MLGSNLSANLVASTDAGGRCYGIPSLFACGAQSGEAQSDKSWGAGQSPACPSGTQASFWCKGALS